MATKKPITERIEKTFARIAETRTENLALLLSVLQDLRTLKTDEQRQINRVAFGVTVALHGQLTELLVRKGILSPDEAWGTYAAALAMIEKAMPGHPDATFCRSLFAQSGLLEPNPAAAPTSDAP